MKLTPYLNELINSRITLTPKEIAIVEEFIEKKSTPVKPEHLNHHKCVSVSRRTRTDCPTTIPVSVVCFR